MNEREGPRGAPVGVGKENSETPEGESPNRIEHPIPDRYSRGEEADLARPSVLLVDDQPARLLTYEAVLEGVGVNCVRALSGQEALHKLLTHTFALILLDVSMPGMDGFETARFIREHPRFERTPIIFVTGIHVNELDTLRGYEAGAIDYIPVPIVPEILRSKVALLVELYRRRAELETLNRDLQMTRARLEAERRSELAAGESQLRESEARYRTVFENPMQLTFVLEAVRDGHGVVTDWSYRDANVSGLKFLDRSHEALLDQLFSNVMGDRAENLIPAYARVLDTRIPYRYECRAGESDFLMCVFPMGSELVVSSGVDITARITAEREIKRSLDIDRAQKEWLGAVLDSMNEEVYFTDVHKRYTYANPAAIREFGHESVNGVSVEKVISSLEVLRPDGTPRPMAESPPLRALGGEVIRGEEQIVRIPRTGELRHRQVSSAPVRDGHGIIIGAVSVVRDVTEQRRADAALRIKDIRTAALLELSDEFRSVTTPADLAFAAARLLGETLAVTRCGYGTIDAVSETISIEREWNAPGIQSLAGVLHFRDYGTYIDDLKRGETVICSDAYEDPRTVATAAALDSISARSFVNMPVTEQGGFVALLYLNHVAVRAWPPDEVEFIREVADRTRVAVERRRNEQEMILREQQLREADRRKDEFIAMLAHELRNPLVPIRSGIELLKHAAQKPALIDTVRPTMERQIGHVVRLIDDLLDVSRITSGKIELQRQAVTLSSVVGTAVEANRAAMDAGRLDLLVNLDEPHWLLDVDPTRLSQVISNLLQNAVKFTAQGGRIEIRGRIDSIGQAGVPELDLTILDSGAGIRAELLPRIFDLFARADVSGRDKHSGLGIGLAMSRRLVEMHFGALTVHSEGEGRGSSFTIRLPAPRLLQQEGQNVVQDGGTELAGLRIMVIDDNHDAADAMSMLVAAMGAVVEVAYDGPSGLTALTSFRPDVILLDIGMPFMDGYETCRRVRELAGHNVGVVALSGWGQEQDKHSAAQAGFDAHLTKPADPMKLQELIRGLNNRLKAN
jgi:PAS domain S-box-containing protein